MNYSNEVKEKAEECLKDWTAAKTPQECQEALNKFFKTAGEVKEEKVDVLKVLTEEKAKEMADFPDTAFAAMERGREITSDWITNTLNYKTPNT